MTSSVSTLSTQSRLASLVSLIKLPIAVMVTMSAATGYLCHIGDVGVDLAYLSIGVFLLAAGAAVVNQIQDAKVDAMMPRTAGRPIPKGRISHYAAARIASALLVVGSGVLLCISQNMYLVLGMGLSAVIWYIGVYYSLKRITAFAAVPGAVIGAIPPAMGWASSGGDLGHPLCILLCTFVFLWQIPHFWLVALHRAEEYQRAGLPSMVRQFSRSQLRRITAVWILAVASGGIVFPILGRFDDFEVVRWVMVGASVWLAILAFVFLLSAETNKKRTARTFGAMNGYIAVMMISLCIASF